MGRSQSWETWRGVYDDNPGWDLAASVTGRAAVVSELTPNEAAPTPPAPANNVTPPETV